MACSRPFFLKGSNIPLPCGKCAACERERANMWTQRMMDEFNTCGRVGCILTLTYASTDGNLHKDDLQKFIKRLRKRIAPLNFRYFACGEYGGKGNRPHYHMCIFGWRPDDLRSVSRHGDIIYYRSDFIADVWAFGFISVGDITADSCKYCCKYLQKLDRRPHDIKPFTICSLKPGIGYYAISPDMLRTGERYIDGKCYHLPKYYIDKLEQKGYNVDIIKARRQVIAQDRSDGKIPFNGGDPDASLFRDV